MILKKIQNTILSGDLLNGKILIDQYQKNIGINDETKNMEAIINFYDGNTNEALKNIREGLKYNRLNDDLYCSMGNVYEALGEYNRAYLCYENAIYCCEDSKKKNIIMENINSLKNNMKVTVNNISIIIRTHNNLEYTKQCIDCLKRYNSSNTYEIVVVDNNSSDGTVNWLKSQVDLKVIYSDEKESIGKQYNAAINACEKENDILLLRNDTNILDNTIFNLRMGIYSSDKVGATGAISNNIYNQKILENYEDIGEYIKYSLRNNISDDSKYEKRIKLSGFAMLIKRKVFNEIGLFDERFVYGNYIYDDISFRIIKSGYENLLCKDSFAFNYGVNSSNCDADHQRKLLENDERFKEKWGFSPLYSTFIRHEIISMIEENQDKNIRVLEVGCACGATLLQIKNKYKNAEIFGIEINEKASEIAKCFCDIRAENIESIHLSYEEGYFDYIIFADVLEHLYNPNLVIRNMKKYLKKEGKIIASIPNVMHYSVVMNLINGNWHYEDSGILDKTHVKFFTLKEIQNMFANEGYNIELINGKNIGVTEEGYKFIEKIKEISPQSPIEQFSIYQYIISAKIN